MTSRTALVIRATGTQGRSVCRKLLERGFQVHAIVGDATESRAVGLQDAGVVLFEGSIDDRATLDEALKGCNYLFLALMPRFDEEASELRQAKFITCAARESSTPVKHLVLTTSLSTDSGRMHMNDFFKKALENKQRVETEVCNAGFDSWTILRPGYFMANFLWPLSDFMFPDLGRQNKFVAAFEPQTPMPLIDTDDIGSFTAAAFQDPARFNEQIIPLASQNVQAVDIVKALEKASGKHLESTWIPTKEAEELAKTNLGTAGQLLSRSLHEQLDYEKLKRWDIPLSTFEAFLEREMDLVKKTFDPDSETFKLFGATKQG